MTSIKFKKLDIEVYEPGKSAIEKLKKITKLSANESALGISPKAKKVLSNKKIAEFYKAEKEFKKRMLDRLKSIRK